jgi:hypothetical protein
MTKSPALLALASLFLILFGLGIAGCGGSGMMNGNNTRQLQSLTVTPASADARNFPSGQVQFTAMGMFNMAPMTMMSPPVRWSIGSPFATQPMPMSMSAGMSPAASVDSNGLAQCNGFTGIATIQATAPADPSMPLSQMGMMTRTVAGMGQLTCP